MTYHILVITSSYLSQYIKDTLGEPPENVEFRFAEYRKFADLERIYLQNEGWADGVFTTGIVVQTVLERTINVPLKPIFSLDTDNESFYRIPLSLLIEDRTLDPERIIFDVFVNVAPEISVLNLMESKSMSKMFPEFFKWLSNATMEELERVEQDTLERIKELWEQDKIDMVICRYSSLVPELQKLHIPCVFATGTDDHVHDVLRQLLARIKIDKITSHAPAVILITPRETKDHVWTERMEIALQKAVMDFAYKNDLKFMLQPKREQIYVLTEKVVISYVTDDFRQNKLSVYLKEHIDFNLSISYGVGNSLEEAMENARKAYIASGISGDCFLVDEEQKLIGPLDEQERTISSNIITPRMQEISKASSLSTATIHRISRLLIFLGRREITSSELAENFHMSLRGANRILQKLEDAGFAKSSQQKSSHMRGRPTKVYRIDLD
ncbi:MAG: hypothetical protein ACI4CC_01310 [Lachnospiraceae bacterium]